jgi:hypothetical protein
VKYLNVIVPVVCPELPARVARIEVAAIAVPVPAVSGDVMERVGDHLPLSTWVVGMPAPQALAAAAFVPSVGIEAYQ